MAGSNHCNTEDTVHNVVDVMPCDNVPGSDHDNTENEVRSVANEVLGAVDQAVDAVAGVVVTGCAHDNTQDEVCDVADQAVDVVADDAVPGSAHDNIENEVRNVANEVLGAVDEAVDVVADDVLPGSTDDNTQDEVCDVADQAVDMVADDAVPGGAHDNTENEVRNVVDRAVDSDHSGNFGGVVKRVRDRASRLRRRHLIALRRQMLSFEPPPRLKYKRVIPPADSSDDSDVDEMPEVVNSPITDELDTWQKTSRKRCRNPEKWKRNRIKKARTSGSMYVNYRGETVAAKKPKIDVPLCHNRCRFKCSDKIDNELRNQIFAAFYSMTAHAQDVYLCGCINTSAPKLVSSSSESHREISCVYTVSVSGEQMRVCKKAFQNLHVISEAKVSHITQQLKLGVIVPVRSMRGKHHNRPNKISDNQRQRVHDHIKSFPAEMSHYSRAKNSNRMYLSSTLSVNVMYKDYANRFIGNEKPVSGTMYRSIFCSDFNLGFGSPRSDTCGRCETLLGDTLNRHKQSADEAYKQLKIDRELAKEGSCIFMTYDMEKTMPLPKLSVGEAFYLRQIWLYNVGVHVVSQKREGTYFQIWTEVSSSSGPEA